MGDKWFIAKFDKVMSSIKQKSYMDHLKIFKLLGKRLLDVEKLFILSFILFKGSVVNIFIVFIY